ATFNPTPQAAHAILTGDFNFPPENPAYGDIQQPTQGVPSYLDAWPLVHGHRPHEPTFCVHSDAYSKTPYCCDFVFVSADAARRVRNVTVDSQTQASDHQPMLLDFDDR
ncbi:MAG: hypothetical protein ACXWBQ_20160, partial [Usitatibacter sp.]